MNRKRASILMALILAMVFAACASTEQFRTNTYRTLAVSADIYESGYPAFLDLHRQGIVSDEVKEQGREIALKYWAAYHAAVEAFEAWETIRTSETQERVNVALQEVSVLLAELTRYIQPFLQAQREEAQNG